MKLIKRSVCMEIKGITNLVHQELNNAKGRPSHPGTMMQKLFLGYLDAHRDRDVYQKDLEAAFHIRRSTATRAKQELDTLFTLLDKVRGRLAPGKEEPFID